LTVVLCAFAIFTFLISGPPSAQARVSLTDLQNQIVALQELVNAQQAQIEALQSGDPGPLNLEITSAYSNSEGGIIYIHGINFGDNPQVKLNEVPLPVNLDNSGSDYIEAALPPDLEPGVYRLAVAKAGAVFSHPEDADIMDVTVETDPTVPEEVKDGIAWEELTNVPPEFADGTDDGIAEETDPVFTTSPANGIDGLQINNWNSAFSWGNHGAAGYLTSYTETDPVFAASPASGIVSAQIGNWNAAHGWGDHSAAGYLTSYTETDPKVGSLTNNYVPKWSETSLVNGTIFDNGNVGINTITPSNDLEIVVPNQSHDRGMTVSGTGAGTGQISMVLNSDGHSFWPKLLMQSRAGGTNVINARVEGDTAGSTPALTLRVQQDSDGSALENRQLFQILNKSDVKISVAANGNMGIGIVDPAEKLEVDGTVKAAAFKGAAAGLNLLGNVGINTITPSNDLEIVVPNQSGDRGMTVSGTGASAGKISMVVNADGQHFWPKLLMQSRAGGTNVINARVLGDGSGDKAALLLRVQNDENDQSLSNRALFEIWNGQIPALTLAADGTLWIDSINVNDKLEVDGTVKASAYEGGDLGISFMTKVGIGTAAPSNDIEVVVPDGSNDRGLTITGANSGSISLVGSSGDGPFYPKLAMRSTAGGTNVINARVVGDASSNAAALLLRVQNDENDQSLVNRPLFQVSNSNTPVMTMAASGDVGFGTSVPKSNLHVKGTGVHMDSTAMQGVNAAGDIVVGSSTPDNAYKHVALFENSAAGGDGIAIKVADTEISSENNFITFYNGENKIAGRVEGFRDPKNLADIEDLLPASLDEIKDMLTNVDQITSFSLGNIPPIFDSRVTGEMGLSWGWWAWPHLNTPGVRKFKAFVTPGGKTIQPWNIQFSDYVWDSLDFECFTMPAGIPNICASDLLDLHDIDMPLSLPADFKIPLPDLSMLTIEQDLDAAVGILKEVNDLVDPLNGSAKLRIYYNWALKHGLPMDIPTNKAEIKLFLATLLSLRQVKDQGVSYGSKGADYAEWLEKRDPAELLLPGMVVGVKGGKSGKDTTAAEQVMVVSHSPVVVGNLPDPGEEKNHTKVGFMGQVQTLVEGPVKSGDLIVASGRSDGLGRAVSPENVSLDDLSMVLGRSWSTENEPGIHMVNVVIGIKTNEWIEIFRRHSAGIMAARDIADDNTAKLVALAAENRGLRDELAEVKGMVDRIEDLAARWERASGKPRIALNQ